MPRPPIPPGEWGVLSSKTTGEKGEKAWYARASYRDLLGRKHDLSAHGRTKVIAEKKLLRKPTDLGLNRGVTAYSTATPIDEFFSKWLEGKRDDGVTVQTLGKYRGVWRRHIEPTLGGAHIGDITTRDLDDLLDGLRGAGITSEHSSARQILQGAFYEAMRNDVLTRDPSQYLSSPNKKRLKKRGGEPDSLDPAEVKIMLDHLRDLKTQKGHAGSRQIPIHEIFALCVCGLRIGEVIGLRRGDFDFTKSPHLIRVQGAVRGDGGPGEREWVLGGKGGTSARAVAIPESISKLVREWLDITDGDEADPLFPTPEGDWRSANNVRRRWREIREELGLETVTPHTLRRTIATFAAQVTDAEQAARLLGHASPQMTRDHYITRSKLLTDQSKVIDLVSQGKAPKPRRRG